MKSNDEKYMRRCFELARKGMGLTRTNPLVGCVIVHQDRIIGEGYHHEFGGPHAEVLAIRSVENQELLPESTLYSNLEPCAHYGKTPPCSRLIAEKSIRRVVISNQDPFPSVDGKGIHHMEKAGAEVVIGILAAEGLRLNRRFFTYHLQQRPYVVLKWAQTVDRFIDLERAPDDPVGTNWITDEVSRTLVHKWRSEEPAILVGTDTVLIDNPRLNIRRWSGTQPLRVTIDRNGRLQKGAHILDGQQETLVFSGRPETYSGKIRTLPVDPSFELSDLLEELHEEHILSLFVEGGARIHRSFLDSGLWDEARVFTGKMSFSQGVPAPRIDQQPDERYHIRDTLLEVYRNRADSVHL